MERRPRADPLCGFRRRAACIRIVMVATMTPSTQVPVLLKITTMLMMVVVIMTMTLNIITITMVLISAIIIIIIVVMIIIIRATRVRPAPHPRAPPLECKAESRPLVAARHGQLCFLGVVGGRALRGIRSWGGLPSRTAAGHSGNQVFDVRGRRGELCRWSLLRTTPE